MKRRAVLVLLCLAPGLGAWMIARGPAAIVVAAPVPPPAASPTPKPAPSASPAPSATPKPAPSPSPAPSRKRTSPAAKRAVPAPSSHDEDGREVLPGQPAAYVAEGVIRSDKRVEIKSRIAAAVRVIHVEEGATVKQGELLIELANDAERAQLDAAKAEVERARSALVEAELRKKTADRELARNLPVADLMTEKDLEMSRDAAAQAAAALDMRSKELARAEAMVAAAGAIHDGTMIRAPFDGLVSRIHTGIGAMPRIAETSLLDLVSLDDLYIEVALPLQYLKQVKRGMPARVLVEGSGVNTRVSAKGTVKFVYPEVDPVTRMFRVKIDVQRRGSQVMPGMFAKVNVGRS